MTTYKIARELPLAFYMNRPYHKDIAPRTGKLSLIYLLLIRREFDYDKTNMCNSNTSCTGQEHSAQTLLTFQTSNKNMNIKMCVHDAFLKKTFIRYAQGKHFEWRNKYIVCKIRTNETNRPNQHSQNRLRPPIHEGG